MEEMLEFPMSLPSPVLVGVSGGADSTFLLHYLMEKTIPGIIVCHLNHGLRGADSDEDAAFVSALSAHYNLPYECRKINLPELMEETGETSFEVLARKERLRFFQEVGKRYGTADVVLAHHAGDQAETLLMNLCRGSAGLKGIDPIMTIEEYGLTLWRPLLSLRKNQLITWLKQRNLSWREDHTNQDPIATRNRIRNEILPLLMEIFSRDVIPNINRAYQPSLRSLLPEILREMRLYDPQGRLFLPRLQELSLPLQKLALHTYLTEQGVENLSDAKISECLTLVSNLQVWKVNLPGNLFLQRKEKRLFLQSAHDC